MKLSIKQYASILDQALTEAGESGREKVIKDFAASVVADNKSSRMSEILQIWRGLYNKRHGIIDVSIHAADKDDATFPHSFAGKRVALNVSEDKELLGGTVTRIGDYVIDNSIKSKVNVLRQ